MKYILSTMLIALSFSSFAQVVAPEETPSDVFVEECTYGKDWIKGLLKEDISEDLECVRRSQDYLVSDLSTLITGKFTALENQQVVNLLLNINHQALLLSQLFENTEVITAEQAEYNKQKIKASGLKIAQNLKEIYQVSDTKMGYLNEQIIQYLPSIAKLILGSNKTEISNAELPDLINNLPQIMVLAYESAQNKNIERSQKEQFSTLSSSLEFLNYSLKDLSDNSAARVNELNKLAQIKNTDLSTYLGQVKFADFGSRISLLKKIASKSLSFHRFYDNEQIILQSPSRSYQFPNLRVVFVHQKALVEEFISIVNEKHFTKRTAEAVVEWGIINEIKAHLKSDAIPGLLPENHEVLKSLVGETISLEVMELSSRKTAELVMDKFVKGQSMSAAVLSVTGVNLEGQIDDELKLWTKRDTINLINSIQAVEVAFTAADVDLNNQLSPAEIKSLSGLRAKVDEINQSVPAQLREEAFKFTLEKGYAPSGSELAKYAVRANRSLKIQKSQLYVLVNNLSN